MTSTGQPWSEPTLWPEDTPANPSHSPANVADEMILDTSGPCSPSAFAWYDHDTRSWRTSQATLVSDSDLFSETWPRSGMTHDGTAYQLRPSAPRTLATESSLSLHGGRIWSTATTRMIEHPWEQLEELQSGDIIRHDHAGNTWSAGLANEVRFRNGDPSVSHGQLNPEWVEWLMGFPAGWTDLEASETP